MSVKPILLLQQNIPVQEEKEQMEAEVPLQIRIVAQRAIQRENLPASRDRSCCCKITAAVCIAAATIAMVVGFVLLGLQSMRSQGADAHYDFTP